MSHNPLDDLLNQQMTRKQFLLFGTLAVGSVFGIVGIIKQLQSHAATATATIEPEDGTTTLPAVAVADTTASGSKAVEFTAPTTTGAIPTPGTYKPSATTTGVWNTIRGLPAGTALTVVSGAFSAAANTTYTGKDFTGLVTVNQPNVTFQNCRFRGGPGTGNAGLITCWGTSVSNLLVEDCTFVPDTPSYWLDAIVGHDFTIRRCDIKWTVDGIGVQNTAVGANSNAVIEANYIHDLSFFAPDPNHPNDANPDATDTANPKWSHTHNDGVQIQSGNGTRIVGNWIDGHLGSNWPNWDPTTSNPATWHPNPFIYNGYGTVATSCIQITPNVGDCTNLFIDSNWFYGGAVGLNSSRGAAAADGTSPKYAQGGTLSNNQFIHTDGIPNFACAIYTTYAAAYTKSNNRYEDTQTPIVYKNNTV